MASADSKKSSKPANGGKSVVVAKKSIANCTSFDQTDKEDDTVEMTIHNTCSMPIDCVITWRLVCAPDSKTRRSVHAGTASLALMNATSQSTSASAATCKDDGWLLDQVRWNCQPNKN